MGIAASLAGQLRWLVILSMFAIVLYKPLTPAPSCFDLHALDVGQGLAVVVQSDKRTFLYYTGASFRDEGIIAEQVVLPFLRFNGIDAIDWLVVLHGDNDHAGGIRAILDNIVFSKIYLGEALAGLDSDRDQKAESCVTGERWHQDVISYQFLHPQPGSRVGVNDASCVLSVAPGDHSVLLIGE